MLAVLEEGQRIQCDGVKRSEDEAGLEGRGIPFQTLEAIVQFSGLTQGESQPLKGSE